MNKKEYYKNGQIVFEDNEGIRRYYFKNGQVKACGKMANGLMVGEWRFYRETGQLWQVGHFIMGKKNGSWIRYSKTDELEYNEVFKDDKLLKK